MGNRARETGSGAAMLGILLLAVFFAANVRAEGLRAPYTIAAPQEPSGKSPGTVGDDGYEQKASRGAPVRDVPAVAAIRLEASGGHCRHQLAPDASWSYREWGNYETHIQNHPKCYQVGLLWLPHQFDGIKWGYRASLVDLGTITADNSYPTNEQAYFLAKATRTAVQSDTGRFYGSGSSRGLTLGLAAERHIFGLDLGAEVGLALLRSTWHVEAPHMATTSHCRSDWACADGNQITPYFGVNARWKYLFISVRQYTSVHASQSDSNPLFVGPTSGPVMQATFGASLPI